MIDGCVIHLFCIFFFFSSRRRHTRYISVTGVQTCALPISKNRKYSIFTMNGGKTFLASIEEKRLNGKYYPEFSKTVNSIEEGLIVLSTNLILGWLWEEK